jgi:hypothetical protein
MASTYSELKIELIGTGEQSGTWGITTNTNLGTALGEAITGSADVAFSSADVTITLTNTNTSQTARNLRLNLTGTSGGARNLILGSGCQIEKLYLVNNGLADAVTVKNTTGSGIAVPAGKTMFVYNNGTDVVDALSYFAGSAAISGGSINGTTIGNSSPSTGAFTTLSASSTVSGTGFSTYLASPPAIGGTLANAGSFTTLSATGNLTVDGNTTLGNASGDTITANAGTMNIPNNLVFNGTGSISVPNGTTGERPTPTAGMIRYNSSTDSFEGYTTVGWGAIGGGASAEGAIYQNINFIASNFTFSPNSNGMSVGPITINAGVTVTVPDGQRWVIL